MYALNINGNEFPDIKLSKYGNASIVGEIHDLGVGIEYEVKAIEQLNKNGYNYKVINIRREKPANIYDMSFFLNEILTQKQAEILYSVYPNIVELVMQNKEMEIDLGRLKGIKEFTFNKIKEKIVENFCLAELVNEFQGLINLPMLKKLYTKYTSVQRIKSKLRKDPYKCLCGLARVGFKTADSLLLELEKGSVIDFDEELKVSSMRCLSCMLYLLEENEKDGHTIMSILELRNQCAKLVPACANHFVECMKNSSIHYDKKKMIVALDATYKIEQSIVNDLEKGLKNNTAWDFDIEEFRGVNGCKLSDEQIKILELICKNNICILNGAAGCGKSFSSQAVINMLKKHKKTFKLFSPTGRAAKVLSEYTKEEATTIHRGLGYMPPDIWSFNKEYKMSCDVLAIDEFSMTDIFLFRHVMDALDLSKTKLLLIGDNAQLPSVACGNLLHDMMESGIIPTVTLSKVFRYGEGGLMKVATDVRLGEKYLYNIDEKITYFGENKDYAFVNCDSSYIIKNAIAIYQKLITQGLQPSDIQVLTAYKKGEYGSIAINNHLQKIANQNYGSSNNIKVGDLLYYENDLVMQNVNNYHAKLFNGFNQMEESEETFIANGETGVIKEVYQSYVIIDFDGIVVKYYRNDMQMISLGYSMSIHKSQGSNARVVILLTPSSHKFMLNSNLLYVGLTRMREKCFHLGDISTVNLAIKKKANLIRNTSAQLLFKDVTNNTDTV